MMNEYNDDNLPTEGPGDRCEIDPIAALREEDGPEIEAAYDEMLGKKRKPKVRARVAVEYSVEPAPVPSWQADPSKLPKKPPRRPA